LLFQLLFISRVLPSPCLSLMKLVKSIISPSLPYLFIGTPRIFNFILLLIIWVRSFIMSPSMKFAEDKVLVFVILLEKCKKIATLKSNPNPNPNFHQSRLIR